jgi:hypothetical protein
MKEEVHPDMLNFVIAIFVAVPIDLAIYICWKVSIKKYLYSNFCINTSSSYSTAFKWIKSSYTLKIKKNYLKVKQYY